MQAHIAPMDSSICSFIDSYGSIVAGNSLDFRIAYKKANSIKRNHKMSHDLISCEMLYLIDTFLYFE